MTENEIKKMARERSEELEALCEERLAQDLLTVYRAEIERKLEKLREQKRAWKARNRDTVREGDRRYQREHPEKVRQWSRDSYTRNRETVIERTRRYRAAHLEKERERARRYYQAHREKVLEQRRLARLER